MTPDNSSNTSTSEETEKVEKNTRLLDEAWENGAKLFSCAAKLERAGYNVIHVNKNPDTGVLLEAQKAEATTDEGATKIIQISGGYCNFDGVDYESVVTAYDDLLAQIGNDRSNFQ
jgi:hypothetical protein